jgi:hypothetical protein
VRFHVVPLSLVSEEKDKKDIRGRHEAAWTVTNDSPSADIQGHHHDTSAQSGLSRSWSAYRFVPKPILPQAMGEGLSSYRALLPLFKLMRRLLRLY